MPIFQVNKSSICMLFLVLFILKPNFNSISPLFTRFGDFLFILFFLVILLSNIKDFVVPKFIYNFNLFILLLLSSSFFMTILLNIDGVYNWKDLFEIFRVPFFITLPFLIGYNILYQSLNNKVFILLYFCFALIMFLQIVLGANNLLINAYSQAGLSNGRATGTALFIQEGGWLLLSITSVLLYFNPKFKYVLMLLSIAISLLTASKSALLVSVSFVMLFFTFENGLKFFSLRNVVFFILFFSLGFYIIEYLAETNEQFRVSVYDGFINAVSGDLEDRSYSARISSLDQVGFYLQYSPYLFLNGFMPLTTYDTIRFEMSFFSILAKYGLLGLLGFIYIFLYPVFRKDKIIDDSLNRFRCSLLALSMSVLLMSFTGATIEGVKGSFLFFTLMGVYLRLYENQKYV